MAHLVNENQKDKADRKRPPPEKGVRPYREEHGGHGFELDRQNEKRGADPANPRLGLSGRRAGG